MTVQYDSMIVGAGVAGLILGHRLKKAGLSYAVLEKSRGLGGRLATRRTDTAVFDHGAQFFKPRPSVKSTWEELQGESPPLLPWIEIAGRQAFASPKGMTQFAKHLALNQEVKLNEKVTEILFTQSSLTLKTDTGNFFSTNNIYLTCPLPQSLELLETSRIEYDTSLKNILYNKALVGLFEVQSKQEAIEAIKYIESPGGNIFSMSNQKSKNVSPSLAFSVVMQPEFSKDFFDFEDRISLEKITNEFQSYLDLKTKSNGSKIIFSQLKKWRYSHPDTTYPKPFAKIANIETKGAIYLIGDAFGGAGISGAIESAASVPLP